MKVLRRILIKFFILLLVIAAAGGGACAWRAYEQSTPEYAMEQYLTYLIENSSDKAMTLLDQSENAELTEEEYKGALEARKYSLYSGFRLTQQEKRRDPDGNEYIDFHVEFLNAADEVKLEDDFTAKKQAEAMFGVFDRWKIMAEHCMAENFGITVPAGSQLYLNNVLADSAWIAEESTASEDIYVIPSIIPGDISLTVRHPILESLTVTLDATGEPVNYSEQMELKQEAEDTCKEAGVKALKTLLSSAVKGELEDKDSLFASCEESANQYVVDQAAVFQKEDEVFKSVASSDFVVQLGALIYTGDANDAITTEMTFTWHYVIEKEVTYDTGEYYEDGTSIWETKGVKDSGDATAEFVMSYYDEAWHIAEMNIPVISD